MTFSSRLSFDPSIISQNFTVLSSIKPQQKLVTKKGRISINSPKGFKSIKGSFSNTFDLNVVHRTLEEGYQLTQKKNISRNTDLGKAIDNIQKKASQALEGVSRLEETYRQEGKSVTTNRIHAIYQEFSKKFSLEYSSFSESKNFIVKKKKSPFDFWKNLEKGNCPKVVRKLPIKKFARIKRKFEKKKSNNTNQKIKEPIAKKVCKPKKKKKKEPRYIDEVYEVVFERFDKLKKKELKKEEKKKLKKELKNEKSKIGRVKIPVFKGLEKADKFNEATKLKWHPRDIQKKEVHTPSGFNESKIDACAQFNYDSETQSSSWSFHISYDSYKKEEKSVSVSSLSSLSEKTKSEQVSIKEKKKEVKKEEEEDLFLLLSNKLSSMSLYTQGGSSEDTENDFSSDEQDFFEDD